MFGAAPPIIALSVQSTRCRAASRITATEPDSEMVTRQAIEPAVAANAPTATPAIEPDCTAKTLAIETGAAKQPSNQAIAPPCTAIALADPAIELEDIKEQIIAHVIERRDEIPCGADVELIAHAFAKKLADILKNVQHLIIFEQYSSRFQQVKGSLTATAGARLLSAAPGC